MESSRALSCPWLSNPRYVNYEESHRCAASVPQIKCLKGKCWKTSEAVFMGSVILWVIPTVSFSLLRFKQMISFSDFLFQDLSNKVGNNFELSHVR